MAKKLVLHYYKTNPNNTKFTYFRNFLVQFISAILHCDHNRWYYSPFQYQKSSGSEADQFIKSTKGPNILQNRIDFHEIL